MQQQICRIAKYILLSTEIILVCNNSGFVDPVTKTELSHFAVSPTTKVYNHIKFAMYLENYYYGGLGSWRKICRVRTHAPSILAGVHAISKAARCLLPFHDSRCALYLLFFLMLLLLSCFWQIYKCIKMQLDPLSFERWFVVIHDIQKRERKRERWRF